MTERPEKVKVIRGWILKAESDFKNAENTLRMKPDECPFDTVCFHAQQVAEKYLKALLVQQTVDFPKTHDIGVLVDLFPPDSRPPLSLEEQDTLSEFAVDSRYPDDPERMGPSQASQAWAIAQRVRTWARNLLPKKAL